MLNVQSLDRAFYSDFADSWDNSLFRERILSHLKAESVVLDLGAGAGILTQMRFKGLCRSVCGVDPSPAVLSNPHLDCARIGTGDFIPWSDKTFDLVFSNNVLEHLAKPEKVFAEVRRVLKPGGVFMVKTPNRWHYVSLIAQVTPFWFHCFFNRLRGRAESATFPTHYRANSKDRLLRLAKQIGFTAKIERIEGRPEYMRFPLLYPFGILWERAVNRFESLAWLRVILIAEFQFTIQNLTHVTDATEVSVNVKLVPATRAD